MGWENHVGRVGALAVALGIGYAVAVMPGVAWAKPDDATSADTPSATTSASDSTGAQHDSETSPAEIQGSRGDKRTTGKAATRHRQTRSYAADSEISDRPSEDHPQSHVRLRTDDEAQPNKTSEYADDTPAAVDEPSAPASQTERTSLFSRLPLSHSSNAPAAPVESPVLWTVLAYARRHAGEQKIEPGVTAPRSSTVDSAKPASAVPSAGATTASTPGSPEGPVIISAAGTIYQVASDLGVTRVSILDSDGQVVNTSADIAGNPTVQARAVTRPDGTLVVLTTNSAGTRSIVSAVDSQGNVTQIGSVVGQPLQPLTVAANGAVFAQTYVPNIFTVTRPARLVRISATDTVRTFNPGQLTVAPDGSAYVVSRPLPGIASLVAVGPDGLSKTTPLPSSAASSTAVIGGDGNGYLAVGTRQLFGGKNTRLYTLDGTSSTVRTIPGLPGRTVAVAEGVHQVTYTFDSFNDDFTTATTYISKVTAGTIQTSDAIDGRLANEIQVTSDGTVYAALLDYTSVAVVHGDGDVSTVTIPGQIVLTTPTSAGGNVGPAMTATSPTPRPVERIWRC